MSSRLAAILQEDLESVFLVTTSCGFGLKAFLRPQNAEIAMKLLTGENMTEAGWDNELRELLKEAEKARCVQSERILPVIGCYQSQGLLGLLTEWMHNGSLHSLIHQCEIYPELPLCLTIRILADVAEGLCHLHRLSPPLLHQGLKPSNILLDALYRAKICDYGLTNWRKHCLRSASPLVSNAKNSYLVYLSPETLQGKDPTAAGDIYSFGMTCWETLSRKRPFEGKTTMLKVLTGISMGLRPRTDEEFIAIPNTMPQRNSLVQLMDLCWHCDPDTRPAITECASRLRTILDTFTSEMISSAVYGLMQAKERAVDAGKALSDPHSVQIDLHNLEVFHGQRSSQLMLNQKMPVRTWGQDCRRSKTVSPSSSADSCSQQAPQGRACSVSASRGPALQSCFSIPQTDVPRTGQAKTVQYQRSPGATQWHPGSSHTAQRSNSVNHRREASAGGFCCKGSCCQILASQRETIVTGITEGCLNHILDILRAQRVLANEDYEMISSPSTLTGRVRALLDTCLCLGEGAAHIVMNVLLSKKCSPLRIR